MKKNKVVLGMIGMLVGISACSENKDVAREKIEHYFDSVANDPKSYEFIDMMKPDTFRKSDLIFGGQVSDTTGLSKITKYDYRYMSRIDEGWSHIKWQKSLVLEYKYNVETSSFPDIWLDSYKEYVNEFDSLMKDWHVNNKQRNYLKNNPSKDSIVEIDYGINFRAKNKMGGLVKGSGKISYHPSKNSWGRVDID
jgi:hypothetical protein